MIGVIPMLPLCHYVVDSVFTVTNVATVRDFNVDGTLHTGTFDNFVCVCINYFRKMESQFY